MSAFSPSRLKAIWAKLNPLDRVALVVGVLYPVLRVLEANGVRVPGIGFAGFLVVAAAVYLAFRVILWTRQRLLWSLRNRLIVAYLFIAVVPVFLLMVMALLSAYFMYSQLGAYLLYEEVQRRIDRVSSTADAIAYATPVQSAQVLVAETLAELRGGVPANLRVEFNVGSEFLPAPAAADARKFSGIVESGNQLSFVAVAERVTPGKRVCVKVSEPITSDLLDKVAPYLGPIQLVITRPAESAQDEGLIPFGDRYFRAASKLSTRGRRLQPPAHWFDYEVNLFAKLEAVSVSRPDGEKSISPVFASFSARPSQLNGRLFSSLGGIGETLFQLVVLIGVVFLVLEIAALYTGISLTRTITRAVDELYRATERIKVGELSHRVRIERRDQLGVLGESFNAMTSAVSGLIEEQRQRQRLENELSIAREVQTQLFPRSLPTIPGMQLEAVCRPARMVSGDYYDFVSFGPGQVAMVLSDISGKGISAALLMASLQAALRSQIQLNGKMSHNTAEIVARLNRHLYLNTSDDRYATLFFAVYDAGQRLLSYTNAGHLPPVFVASNQVLKLEEGGTVIGLFEDSQYEQGSVSIGPGSLLVAYSDGLIEPENVYGEQFGIKRMVEVVQRNRSSSPRTLTETVFNAVEEWSGAPEPADDATMIVAMWD